MVEESAHHFFIPAHDRLVKRRKAGRGRVRVGALVEQIFDHFGVTGMSGKTSGTDAPGIRIVHVGAGSHQEFRRGKIAHPRGEQQRGVAPVRDGLVVLGKTVRRHSHHFVPGFRASLHVGAVREQHLHDVGMLLRHRPHQRRLAARRVRIHVRVLVEQLFNDVRIARASGHHHRRLAFQERGVRVRPGCEQPPHHGRASVLAGRPQRRDAKIVRRVHLGAGAKQQVGAFEVILVARPVKGRCAVGFGCVDVRFLLQKSTEGIPVAVPGSVNQ